MFSRGLEKKRKARVCCYHTNGFEIPPNIKPLMAPASWAYEAMVLVDPIFLHFVHGARHLKKLWELILFAN